MRYTCLSALLVMAAALPAGAQDGAALYQARCASCHDVPQERVPPASALRAMSLLQILATLESGPMKTIGDTLQPQQKYAVALYLGIPAPKEPAPVPPAALCSASSKPFRYASREPRWTGWSTDVTNSRFQDSSQAGLTAAEVRQLQLKWAFSLGDETEARSQPAVADGRIFFGVQSGSVYSLDARSGCIYWTSKVDGGIRSAVTLGSTGRRTGIYFGSGPSAYALDARTGKQLWKVRLDDHFAAISTAAPLFHKGVLYFTVSSFEEVLPPLPTYQCCTFRGSVVALKADTGERIWKTFTITDAPHPTRKNKADVQMYGPSGAAVWSTPTFDKKRNVVYVGTGDNYSDPVTGTSDAVLALDAKTGETLWSRQLTSADAYNNACGLPGSPNCPQPAGPDFDIGQPPILVALAGGRRALVFGQKSGMAYALDPDKQGEILWQARIGKGGALGGSEWGSATDGQNLYVALSDIGFRGVVPDAKSNRGFRLLPNANQGGGLFALRLSTGEPVWSAKPASACADRAGCSPAQSQAVTAIAGVVFSGSLDGHLRAYSTGTGEVLWDVDTVRDYRTLNGLAAHGGSLDGPGPVIAGGMVYVSSGYAQFGTMPGNVLLAFSVDGK